MEAFLAVVTAPVERLRSSAPSNVAIVCGRRPKHAGNEVGQRLVHEVDELSLQELLTLPCPPSQHSHGNDDRLLAAAFGPPYRRKRVDSTQKRHAASKASCLLTCDRPSARDLIMYLLLSSRLCFRAVTGRR